jgi:hypothetical protein
VKDLTVEKVRVGGPNARAGARRTGQRSCTAIVDGVAAPRLACFALLFLLLQVFMNREQKATTEGPIQALFPFSVGW